MNGGLQERCWWLDDQECNMTIEGNASYLFHYDRWAIWIGRSPTMEGSFANQTEMLPTWDTVIRT
jgi:hypothetical protein